MRDVHGWSVLPEEATEEATECDEECDRGDNGG